MPMTTTSGGIMARIPKAELTGVYGAVVRRMSRKMLGQVPESVEVADDLSARLLAALGPAALVELTMHVALANLMTRGNTALGVTSQGFADACVVSPT
jgi:hypothetical protein